MIGDINPAIVSKVALPAKSPIMERKTFLESSGLAKRSATSTIAGLRNKIAGFQYISEFGNLKGKEPRIRIASAIITKDVYETNLYIFIYSPCLLKCEKQNTASNTFLIIQDNSLLLHGVAQRFGMCAESPASGARFVSRRFHLHYSPLACGR